MPGSDPGECQATTAIGIIGGLLVRLLCMYGLSVGFGGYRVYPVFVAVRSRQPGQRTKDA